MNELEQLESNRGTITISDLTALEFRFPTSRDALPTPYLHVGVERKDSINEGKESKLSTVLFTNSSSRMISLFSRHGIIKGISFPSHYRYFYLQFQSSIQAAHALNSLNNYYDSQLNAKLSIHFACVRQSKSNSSHSSSSSLPSSTILSLRLYSSVISPTQENFITDIHSFNHKGEVSYGSALAEEDGRFGLPKPKNLPETLTFLLSLATARVGDDTEEQSSLTETIECNQITKLPAPFQTPPSSPLSSEFNSPFTRLTFFSLHPGAGIKRRSHSLSLFSPPLALLPVGGHTVIDFYQHNSDNIDTSVFLTSGSLLCIPEEVSKNYDYGISYRTRDQVGKEKFKRSKIILITLCTPLSQTNSSTLSSEQTISNSRTITHSTPLLPSLLSPEEFESQHVTAVYNSIATHFSNTRHSPWPRIESYVKSIPTGSIVLDVGCGNGKYMGLNKQINIMGCDISVKLIEICRKKGFNAIVADCLDLPFPSNTYTHTICVALLHHLSTPERRITCLKELTRVTQIGGKILVSAWAMEQDRGSRRRFDSPDVLVPWRLPKRFQEKNEKKEEEKEEEKGEEKEDEDETELKNSKENHDHEENCTELNEEERDGDGIGMELSGGRDSNDIIYNRYCHVYVEGEIENLLTEIVGVQIVSSYYDRGNWCVFFEKTN